MAWPFLADQAVGWFAAIVTMTTVWEHPDCLIKEPCRAEPLEMPCMQTKRRGLSNCGVAGAAAFVAALLFGNRFGPAPDPTHPLSSPAALVTGVAVVTGLLQPAALTYIIVHLAMRISGTLSGCLSWRGWRPIADASYDVYLLHPMVMFGVWSLLPPGDWFDVSKPRLLPFLAVAGIVFGISFVLATAHSRAWR